MRLRDFRMQAAAPYRGVRCQVKHCPNCKHNGISFIGLLLSDPSKPTSCSHCAHLFFLPRKLNFLLIFLGISTSQIAFFACIYFWHLWPALLCLGFIVITNIAVVNFCTPVETSVRAMLKSRNYFYISCVVLFGIIVGVVAFGT